ncbi:pentapeptide repeat-containing protein [Halorussus salilacus]|uniref:pentapeptide repeat-containing protein n=1 Tax=Halorussus salilacus TaxID=2953750 RepID=UPI0020A1E6E9|nr:pentapeptide repeat-containing protein [Halorussus salilacus]USZ69411.1 pentapeptide repeat-containing protein [Halorussus salilacus]
MSKSAEELRVVCSDTEVREQCSGYSELLDGAKLSGVNLEDSLSFTNVALRDAVLPGSNLSGVVLKDADLTDAVLWDADLSNANLSKADLSDADLRDIDLSDANLSNSDLSDADLLDADLSNASLRGATLTGADIREADITGVSVTGATTCKRLFEGYDGEISTEDSFIPMRLRKWHFGSNFGPREWESTARAYHELKSILSDHGLVGQSRDIYVRERRARSLEAKADGGSLNLRYCGSLLSQLFTGYGVKVRNLLGWMVALFLFSTSIYVIAGVEESLMRNISYSVLAFTVAPPKIPSGTGVQFVMMIETFFGTLSIVLLGYILGNRERF